MDALPGDDVVRRIARVAGRLRAADDEHEDDGIGAIDCRLFADELEALAREVSHLEALRDITRPPGTVAHLPVLPPAPAPAVAPAPAATVIPFPGRPLYWAAHAPEDAS